MTDRQIQFALKKVEAAKQGKYFTEAYIKSYTLNIGMIKFILKALSPTTDVEKLKAKPLIKHFMKEVSLHPEMKAIIHKRSLKSVQLWVSKADGFFKDLKHGHENPSQPLLHESEKVFSLLKISVNKLLVKAKK